MDLLLFDITDIPDAAEGDAVELLGPLYDADALADDADTIGYEILTSLGKGCRRRYCRTALERGKPAESLPAESLPAENLPLGSYES